MGMSKGSRYEGCARAGTSVAAAAALLRVDAALAGCQLRELPVAQPCPHGTLQGCCYSTAEDVNMVRVRREPNHGTKADSKLFLPSVMASARGGGGGWANGEEICPIYCA
jgi:hypothetical protein